jgi:hypothetical protein
MRLVTTAIMPERSGIFATDRLEPSSSSNQSRILLRLLNLGAWTDHVARSSCMGNYLSHGLARDGFSDHLLIEGQAIATLNQFLEPVCEPRRRRGVQHVVIEADREAEVVARDDLPVHVLSLLADAADRNPADGRRRRWDASPGALSNHANRGNGDRPIALLPQPREHLPDPDGKLEVWAEQPGRQEL